MGATSYHNRFCPKRKAREGSQTFNSFNLLKPFRLWVSLSKGQAQACLAGLGKRTGRVCATGVIAQSPPGDRTLPVFLEERT